MYRITEVGKTNTMAMSTHHPTPGPTPLLVHPRGVPLCPHHKCHLYLHCLCNTLLTGHNRKTQHPIFPTDFQGKRSLPTFEAEEHKAQVLHWLFKRAVFKVFLRAVDRTLHSNVKNCCSKNPAWLPTSTRAHTRCLSIAASSYIPPWFQLSPDWVNLP